MTPALQSYLASGVRSWRSYTPILSSTYNHKISAALCEHATAAYRDIGEYQKAVAESEAWDGSLMLSGAGCEAVITSSESAIVIAVRGTAGGVDIATDGLICRRPWRGMFPDNVGVHLGFRRQADAIHLDVEGALRMLHARRMRRRIVSPAVYITGHSLGGAVASLLHESLQITTTAANCAELYTFGSPRVGGRPWREFTRRKVLGARGSYRVVVVRRGVQDLVTRVPLSRFGWRHVGDPVVIEDSKVLFGQRAWQKVRGKRKTSLVDAWKAIRSVRRGVESHLVGSLLIELRAIARENGGAE